MSIKIFAIEKTFIDFSVIIPYTCICKEVIIINVEGELKNLILVRYKSIREFCFDVDIPYSTIDSILRRGIGKAGVTIIIKICKHLKISADELAVGKITHIADIKISSNSLDSNEEELIRKYRALDERGKKMVNVAIDTEYEHYAENDSSVKSDKLSS